MGNDKEWVYIGIEKNNGILRDGSWHNIKFTLEQYRLMAHW